MALREALKQADLTEGEIDVYIELLREDSAKVGELAEKTDHHRPYIYDTVEKLQEKGLVSSFLENKVKHFSAANPERLLDYIQEKEEQVRNVMDDLKSLSPVKEGTSVELYKGRTSFKTVIRDFLESGDELLMFGQNRFEEILPEFYIKKAVKEMNEENIGEKMLLREGQDIITAEHGEYRNIPEKYLYPTGTMVYDNKVVLLLWEKPYHAIMMEDQDIAESYRKHFQLLWEIADKSRD